MLTLTSLSARHWQDECIHGYCTALVRHAAACTTDATAITALLAQHEPLHEVRLHSYAGHVLWIAYNWHCVRELGGTGAAAEEALREWPEDGWLRRMREDATQKEEAG